MKLIIDIPYHIYEMVTNTGTFGCYRFDTRKAIKKGTPIPDNATNGDVIKVLYPNADIEIHNITVYVIFDMRSNVIPFDLDWWNSLYQKGGKE